LGQSASDLRRNLLKVLHQKLLARHTDLMQISQVKGTFSYKAFIPKSSGACVCSWLEVGIASRVVAVCLHGLVATTGIASGVNGKHHNQDSDAVYPGVVDHS
jgi:hypothetical protein